MDGRKVANAGTQGSSAAGLRSGMPRLLQVSAAALPASSMQTLFAACSTHGRRAR